jgi:hypothetical protein
MRGHQRIDFTFVNVKVISITVRLRIVTKNSECCVLSETTGHLCNLSESVLPRMKGKESKYQLNQ